MITNHDQVLRATAQAREHMALQQLRSFLLRSSPAQEDMSLLARLDVHAIKFDAEILKHSVSISSTSSTASPTSIHYGAWQRPRDELGIAFNIPTLTTSTTPGLIAPSRSTFCPASPVVVQPVTA